MTSAPKQANITRVMDGSAFRNAAVSAIAIRAAAGIG